MDIQRLRNLTTGRLHTEMGHVYQDIEWFIGEKGIMTHQLPNAMRALEPYLRQRVPEPKFWEDVYDTTHTGGYEVAPLDEQERAEFWEAYRDLPSPFERLGADQGAGRE